MNAMISSRFQKSFIIPLKDYLRCDDINLLPVSSHEDQGVDGDVGGDIDDVLDSPADGQTKGPVHEDIVAGGGGDTHQDEQEVSHRQVQDQQVGGVLHLGIAPHLPNEMRVAIQRLQKQNYFFLNFNRI